MYKGTLLRTISTPPAQSLCYRGNVKGEIFNLSVFTEAASECSEDRIALIGVSDVGKTLWCIWPGWLTVTERLLSMGWLIFAVRHVPLEIVKINHESWFIHDSWACTFSHFSSWMLFFTRLSLEVPITEFISARTLSHLNNTPIKAYGSIFIYKNWSMNIGFWCGVFLRGHGI